jgi:hypothetical protein
MHITLRAVIPMLCCSLSAAPLAAQTHPDSARSTVDQPPPRIVTGTVSDAASGRPVPDAAVHFLADGRTAFTDSAGSFTLEDVDYGREDIDVSRPGYAGRTLVIEASDTLAPLAVALLPDTAMLRRMQTLERYVQRARHDMGAQIYDWRQLERAGRRGLLSLIQGRRGFTREACPVGILANDCAYVRGSPRPIRVRIDGVEAAGGLAELLTRRPDDLYALQISAYWYPNIVAYTWYWVRRSGSDGMQFMRP